MDRMFPIFLNVRDKRVLVVGLGEVGYRKALALSNAGAKVTAIGLELKKPEFQDIAEVHIRAYNDSDKDNIFIGIAATNDKDFNYQLCADWDCANIISNNATTRSPQNAIFVHNDIIDDCHVAISGLGDPIKAKTLLNKIRETQQ